MHRKLWRVIDFVSKLDWLIRVILSVKAKVTGVVGSAMVVTGTLGSILFAIGVGVGLWIAFTLIEKWIREKPVFWRLGKHQSNIALTKGQRLWAVLSPVQLSEDRNTAHINLSIISCIQEPLSYREVTGILKRLV